MISWVKAVSKTTPQEELTYSVYQSDENNIKTIDEILDNGVIILNWTKTRTNFKVTKLISATTYYFNILVKDTFGHMASYAMISVTTVNEKYIYMYSAGKHDGNLITSSSNINESARNQADALCRDAVNPSLGCSLENIHAFISIDKNDAVSNFPVNHKLPADFEIGGQTGIRIASSWSDLLGQAELFATLKQADIASSFWWSGSDIHGDFIADSSCNSWTSNSNKANGQHGAHNKTSIDWLSSKSVEENDTMKNVVDEMDLKSDEKKQGRNCNNQLQVLCICWP